MNSYKQIKNTLKQQPPQKSNPMTRKYNTKKGKGLGKGNNSVTQSSRAGLTFPVGRVGRILRTKKYSQRVGAGAPVYAAAVLEYLTAKILELTGNVTKILGVKRIIPVHITLVIQQDDELKKMMQNTHCFDKKVVSNRV